MNGRSVLILMTFTVLILVSTASAGTYWVDNGIVVCDSTNMQTTEAVISDGSGGAIILWRDRRDPTTAIYAQRVNERGESQWAEGGVIVTTFAHAPNSFEAISDGAGGVFFVYSMGFDMVIAGRLDSSGAGGWIRLASSGAGPSVGPSDIAPDGAGGVFVCWADDRNGNDDIFAQRYDADGNRLWDSDGRNVCVVNYNQGSPKITLLGSDAVIFWKDYRNPTAPDLYAQKIDATGTHQWDDAGIAVCTEAGEQTNHQVTTDNSGRAIVVWRDTRNGNYDIFAQSVGSSGTRYWTATGEPVCTTSVSQDDPQLAAFSPGGVIITWEDYNGKGPDWDISAQYLEVHGVPQWGANGRAVCSAPMNQNDPRIFTDTSGAVIAWDDQRNGTDQADVHAQRIDGDGDPEWLLNGIALSDLGGQEDPRIAPDGEGGAIIAWADTRVDEEDDIRAQRIFQDGRTGDPRPLMREIGDIGGDEGGYLRIELRASERDLAAIPYPQITLYNVWRKIESFAAGPAAGIPSTARPRNELLALAGDPDLVSDLRLDPVEAADLGLPPGFWESAGLHPAMQQGAYYFIVPTKQDSSLSGTHWETYVVSAHTTDQGLYFVSFPDSGYSVDNVAPAPPIGLAGEQSFSPEGLRLTWDDNNEADLTGYRVYRGTSDDFIPSPTNLVGAPSGSELLDVEWTWDGGYWYKVAAVDRHGNESPLAVFGPEMVTGDDPMPVPDATFLSQNFPNPFNPVTTIAFGLKAGGFVNLSVYDAAGRLVVTLINESRPAGQYAAAWNGKVQNGSSAASGVYFYRLAAGNYIETRKMILLK
jgi:hypothetical protein